jgi:hypothetical protein
MTDESRIPPVCSDCSLLVASCDAYSDLWPPFFTLLEKYWPNCPFPVYLGSGQLSYQKPKVTTLYSSGGKDWSLCMMDYLSQVPTTYVLLMLDDFFLRADVSTDAVLGCLQFARKYDSVQVRLIPRPGPTKRLAGERLIGECVPDQPYRLSTQAAIWNRVRLMELISQGESIWQFEHSANRRAAIMAHGFYAARKHVLPYVGYFAHHVVEKGCWLPVERWIFSRRNVSCDFSRRRTLPFGRAAFYHAIIIADTALGVLPWRLKKNVKRTFKSLFRPLLSRQFSNMSGANIQGGTSVK